MLYRYSGAGNTFVVVDGRNLDVSRFRKPDFVHTFCMLNGTDALMVLDNSRKADFRMEYFNSDGSGGMMCGNGGRCIVAFADYLGVKPFHSRDYIFEAPDGLHRAEILSHLGECKTVRLQMNDVTEPVSVCGGLLLDTGARHLVLFVDDVETVDVPKRGRELRLRPEFAPVGVNVDFVQTLPGGGLKIRTYEKGVESETLACGTGAVAAALAASVVSPSPISPSPISPLPSSPLPFSTVTVFTRQDSLEVEFRRNDRGDFSGVWLTGPTLFEGEIE